MLSPHSPSLFGLPSAFLAVSSATVMVSPSHLSNGNSESYISRDLFSEFGISRPNSPSLSSPLVLSSEDMVESDPNPQAVSISSDGSTSLDK